MKANGLTYPADEVAASSDGNDRLVIRVYDDAGNVTETHEHVG